MKKCSRVYKKNKDSRLDLTGDSRLQAARSCSRARHARSWSVMPTGALQDKIGQLTVQLPHGWNSRLNQAARPSHEPALFWKTWLFTFHSHPSINTPFTQERKRYSKENFERKTLEKNKIDSSPIFIKRLFKFLNSLPLHCKILERLITKTFSHYIHFCERAVWCFGKQLGRNQFYIGWCYGQVAEFEKLEKK